MCGGVFRNLSEWFFWFYGPDTEIFSSELHTYLNIPRKLRINRFRSLRYSKYIQVPRAALGFQSGDGFYSATRDVPQCTARRPTLHRETTSGKLRGGLRCKPRGTGRKENFSTLVACTLLVLEFSLVSCTVFVLVLALATCQYVCLYFHVIFAQHFRTCTWYLNSILVLGLLLILASRILKWTWTQFLKKS